MPSYNYARYLRHAIESVLVQSYTDFEVIITDDCSTDESREILAEYERLDSRVVCILHKENRGVAGARNSAFAASSGAFIAMCDADDVWLPHKLHAQVDCFRRNSGAGLVHADATLIDPRGNLTGQSFSSVFHGKRQRTAGILFDELCRRNFLCVPTVIVRREALEYAGGFDEQLRFLEDWVCWTTIARKYPFGYVDEPLAHYRIHDASLSKDRVGMAESRIKAIRILLDSTPSIAPTVRASMLYALGVSHLAEDDMRSAVRPLLEAVVADPYQLRSAIRCCQAIAGAAVQRVWPRAPVSQ
jgi:glycosyltransferase involved in cell wall biosynthesis